VLAEGGHAERNVGRDPAPAYDQLVDQEGQGHLVQLLCDQLVSESAGKCIR
jgi:hypothetical protein